MAGTWFDDNPYDPNQWVDPGWTPQPAGGGAPTGGGAAPQPSSISLYDAVAQIYKTALGREGSAQDINSWIQGTGGNLAAIQQGIYASPEAASYSQAQTAKGAASTTTPTGTGSTGPQNGDWQSWFGTLTNGKPPTPDQLIGLESQINAAGGKVLRNAKGIAGKIQLPDGSIVDVIQGADSGGKGWQWLTGSGDSGSSLSGMGSSAAGSSPYGAVGPYQVPQGYGYQNYNPGPAPTPTRFVAPTAEEARNTPGYQFAVEQGQQGLERSAAARGGLLSGGALKDITNYRVGAADQNYQNVWNNAFNANEAGNSDALNAYQAGTSAGLGAGNLNLAGQNQAFQQDYIPSWNAYLSSVGQGQFQQNFGLASQNQGFSQGLARDQFNLGAQNQYWNQGFNENQNAYNQYDNSQKTAFDQWYKLMQAGHPGNPYA